MKRLAVLFAVIAFAYPEYCPWWPQAERTGVKLLEVETNALFEGKPLQIDGFTLTGGENGTRVASGGWEVMLNERGSVSAASVFDLDGNGHKDLLIRVFNGATGDRPGRTLFSIMIGSDGFPRLARHDTFFYDGVRLTDFNKDGKFEITHSGYGGSKRDKHNYWYFVLYEARDAEWHRVIGQYGGIVSPQYTWFTNRANRMPVQFAPGDAPAIGNDSSAAMKTGLRASKIDWRGVSGRVEFSDGSSCTIYDGAEAITIRGKRYEWARPSETMLKEGLLDIVTNEFDGLCVVSRVVVTINR